MKLLFDENLSTALPRVLEPHFPGSQHVNSLGLAGQPDETVWDFAKAQDFLIVSKDKDFRQRSFLHGAPPKVIGLSLGNARTRPIADLFRANRDRIAQFVADEEESFLLFSTVAAD